MIKFVHKKHAEKAKGTAMIIITYSFTEVILGFVLLVTNIYGMVLIYQYGNPPQTQYYSNALYPGTGLMNTQLKR